MKPVDPKISKYFSDLAKKRTDSNRGFSNPEIVKKAVKKRLANAKAKAKQDTPTEEDLRAM